VISFHKKPFTKQITIDPFTPVFHIRNKLNSLINRLNKLPLADEYPTNYICPNITIDFDILDPPKRIGAMTCWANHKLTNLLSYMKFQLKWKLDFNIQKDHTQKATQFTYKITQDKKTPESKTERTHLITPRSQWTTTQKLIDDLTLQEWSYRSSQIYLSKNVKGSSKLFQTILQEITDKGEARQLILTKSEPLEYSEETDEAEETEDIMREVTVLSTDPHTAQQTSPDSDEELYTEIDQETIKELQQLHDQWQTKQIQPIPTEKATGSSQSTQTGSPESINTILNGRPDTPDTPELQIDLTIKTGSKTPSEDEEFNEFIDKLVDESVPVTNDKNKKKKKRKPITAPTPSPQKAPTEEQISALLEQGRQKSRRLLSPNKATEQNAPPQPAPWAISKVWSESNNPNKKPNVWNNPPPKPKSPEPWLPTQQEQNLNPAPHNRPNSTIVQINIFNDIDKIEPPQFAQTSHLLEIPNKLLNTALTHSFVKTCQSHRGTPKSHWVPTTMNPRLKARETAMWQQAMIPHPEHLQPPPKDQINPPEPPAQSTSKLNQALQALQSIRQPPRPHTTPIDQQPIPPNWRPIAPHRNPKVYPTGNDKPNLETNCTSTHPNANQDQPHGSTHK